MNGLINIVNKLKPLPWKHYGIIVAASFLCAQLTSTLLSRILAPASSKDLAATAAPKPVLAEPKIANIDGPGPSLTEKQINSILQRNIFNSEGSLGDKSQEKKDKQGDAEDIIKSDLPLKLVGTIYGGTPYNGIALIENSQKQNINTFVVGDILLKEATISEIHRDKIIVERSGRREFIEIFQTEPPKTARRRGKAEKAPDSSATGLSPLATEPPPPNFKEEGFERKGEEMTMGTDYRDRLLTGDFAKVLQDAKAVPNMVDGALKGFKLERIRKDSIYEKAGFQNDDIIEEINGMPLHDTAGTIKFLNSLRSEKEIEIRFRRGGQVVTKVLNVR